MNLRYTANGCLEMDVLNFAGGHSDSLFRATSSNGRGTPFAASTSARQSDNGGEMRDVTELSVEVTSCYKTDNASNRTHRSIFRRREACPECGGENLWGPSHCSPLEQSCVDCGESWGLRGL